LPAAVTQAISAKLIKPTYTHPMSFQHPLDPLSHGEQELIVAHSRKAWNLQDHHLFAMLQLHEPTKAELSSGKKLDRTARVTIWDRKKLL